MQQEAPRSIMGRRATAFGLLCCHAKPEVLQRETGAPGQVPTLGCQPGGLRIQVWFKWINGSTKVYLLDQNKVSRFKSIIVIQKIATVAFKLQLPAPL